MLVMAWALSSVVQATHLGRWVGGALAGGFPPGLLPFLVVILSFFVSFASGTAFGTMGVIFPISIPAAYAIAPYDGQLSKSCFFLSLVFLILFLQVISTIAATMSGANAGDNCSPFSDTTILSALMAEIPNLQHTKTQFPYALLALVVACLLGFLPVGFQAYNPWVANALQIVFLGFIIFFFGGVSGLYSARDKEAVGVGDDSYFIKFVNWAKVRVLRRGGSYNEPQTL